MAPQGGETAFLRPSSNRYLSQVLHRMATVRALAGTSGHGRVIDLGCGDGRISLQFLPASCGVTLVDTSPAMLERALKAVPDLHRDRVRIVETSIADLEDTAQYDLVLAIGVLAHVSDLPGTLAKVAALVAPNGRAIVQLTDAGTLQGAMIAVWSYLSTPRRGYPLHRLTEQQVVSTLARHQLELADRSCSSAFYRRTPRRDDGVFPARPQRQRETRGAEKFLVFCPLETP